MDERYARGDMRRLPPRNARGEFRRRRRGDRAMAYSQDMRGRDYVQNQDYNAGMRGDYHYDNVRYMARGYDRANQDMRYDGHYPMEHRQGAYEPVEFMGYCSGYYGSPDHRGMDYGYDMRYDRRGMGSDYGYGYDYADYGETLSEEELERWCKKLKAQLDDREKQMFTKDAIVQRVKQMGKPMENFGEKELEVTTLMVYTDYKNSIGQNPDLAVKLAYDWLADKDVKVKGAEKLAVYYDEIVTGGEDD